MADRWALGPAHDHGAHDVQVVPVCEFERLEVGQERFIAGGAAVGGASSALLEAGQNGRLHWAPVRVQKLLARLVRTVVSHARR